ncbi:MAG: acetyl-CoA carboxylase carboxyltransferase subunit alpha [Candidatus Marinimicrobia bacterium]|jgi:acetyl-CoA carboxylase carboxyl transferase subunit alpha|nr:acetyl-CoA carboxylase carboxyltransferase subunit alpha [Candidatus Neomarinimicrobiota bacterium]MBT3675602.1 acetyl-CoA carboxylase carboxyltransferase subunit alpha [Candidatus Neomarinimicrobiota bacterium]MBT3762563.1 acetyl-CoA carboxylase carboxyltransferase subunit alpha [Candidatus Neomarinimicrobiota bacterium]MBT4067169.1 acetyl-CoA carboxylase carboxyltransferase subunit alpha [Candidatus Neomarinimicrobiota bacterium]MBT4270031.1 acetyl-CoA carboxylase carboxyltransferase subun
MADYYLEFEKPIQAIDQKILELEADDSSADHSSELSTLKAKRESSLKKIFSGLSRWQRVQLARHPQRPFSLDYINALAPDFIELHGDRYFGDDAAVISGMGTIDGVKVVIIGQQKGRNTKENLFRNFGMMRPEGYRKALRIMKLAEKFRLPIISLIDTPGAYPGLGAEERGQGEAIAKNLWEMSKMKVPIISVVIGEGASGGALGIGVCDRMLMLENTWYSVISPEGCASILWRDAAKAAEAADAMKVTPDDLMNMGICDRIIEEPLGGAHREFDAMATILKNVLLEEIANLKDVEPNSFLERRIDRYDKMGVYTES